MLRSGSTVSSSGDGDWFPICTEAIFHQQTKWCHTFPVSYHSCLHKSLATVIWWMRLQENIQRDLVTENKIQLYNNIYLTHGYGSGWIAVWYNYLNVYLNINHNNDYNNEMEKKQKINNHLIYWLSTFMRRFNNDL